MALVIKIGTNVVCDDSGRPDPSYIQSLARQCNLVLKQKRAVALVLSGAIGSGMGELGLNQRPADTVMRQVCASVGQPRLMQLVQNEFNRFGRVVAQVLISKQTLSHSLTRTNMSAAVKKMFELQIVPIINENDAIATDEIDSNFGDNDDLSSEFATSIGAQGLLMLTTAPGVLRDGQVIPELSVADLPTIEIGAGSSLGKGGMGSKIRSALKAAKTIPLVAIAHGREADVVLRFGRGEPVGTRIQPST